MICILIWFCLGNQDADQRCLFDYCFATIVQFDVALIPNSEDKPGATDTEPPGLSSQNRHVRDISRVARRAQDVA